jgi:hypothetical protein
LIDVSDAIAQGLDEFPNDVAIVVCPASVKPCLEEECLIWDYAYKITEDNKKENWPKLGDRQAMNFKRAFVFVDAPMGDYPLYQDYLLCTVDL